MLHRERGLVLPTHPKTAVAMFGRLRVEPGFDLHLAEGGPQVIVGLLRRSHRGSLVTAPAAPQQQQEQQEKGDDAPDDGSDDLRIERRVGRGSERVGNDQLRWG